MIERRHITIILGMAILALVSGTAHAAPLADGTVIGVDFGPTAPVNNFNNVNTISGSISAGSVIETNNVVVDGVGFTWGGGWSNNDARIESEIPGQPAVCNDSNLTDWLFFNVRNFSTGSEIGVYSSGGLNTLQVFAFDSVPPPAGTVIIIR